MAHLAHEPARRPMIAQSLCASVALTTGTLLYAYPKTLQAIRAPMVFVHDASGDLLIVAVIVYLWIHLRRTWGLRTFALSWWTGLAAVCVFAVVGLTGLYGQIMPMPSGELLWVSHVVGGIVLTSSRA